MASLLVPAWLIQALAGLNLVILGMAIWRYRSWQAVALTIPMLYLIFVYFLVDTIDITDARSLGRWGFVAVLAFQAVINFGTWPLGGRRNGQ